MLTKRSFMSCAVVFVLERLVRHDVAPVARRVADRQQDRLAGLRAPPRATRRSTLASARGCPRAASGKGSSLRSVGCACAHYRGASGWCDAVARVYTSRHATYAFATLGDDLFTYPEFDPVALTIGPLFGYGPLEVRWYGLMYLVGFVGGWLGARARAKQPWSRIKPEQVDDIVFYVRARRDRRRPRRLHARLRLERADRGSA